MRWHGANYNRRAGLNPCCSGIGSVRKCRMSTGTGSRSLNPCCSGIGSVSALQCRGTDCMGTS